MPRNSTSARRNGWPRAACRSRPRRWFPVTSPSFGAGSGAGSGRPAREQHLEVSPANPACSGFCHTQSLLPAGAASTMLALILIVNISSTNENGILLGSAIGGSRPRRFWQQAFLGQPRRRWINQRNINQRRISERKGYYEIKSVRVGTLRTGTKRVRGNCHSLVASPKTIMCQRREVAGPGVGSLGLGLVREPGHFLFLERRQRALGVEPLDAKRVSKCLGRHCHDQHGELGGYGERG